MSYFTVKIEEGAKAHLGQTLQVHINSTPFRADIGATIPPHAAGTAITDATVHYASREYWADLIEYTGGKTTLELTEKGGRSRLNFPSVTIL